MEWDNHQIRDLISLALREDAYAHDVTARSLIPESAASKATVKAKEECIFCGGPLIDQIVAVSKFDVSVTAALADGTHAHSGTILATLEGSTRSLLSLERTILNFLQRLCGVATYTRSFVDAAGVTVLDTRKTMPGWRLLDKYAVKTGGGTNHRMNLADMVLVKNNHIDAQNGDFRRIAELLAEPRSKNIPIEVEVRTIAELKSLLAEFIPNIIMLDNMELTEIRESIALIRARSAEPTIEISGGITVERCQTFRGLDPKLCVSVGALTTQARNVDISMKISHADR